MRVLKEIRNKALSSVPSIKHKNLMDNLYVDYMELIWQKDILIEIPKRNKVEFNDLDISNLMCLIDRHKPNYSDKTRRVLDIKLLKELDLI
jgi:hypothetical protein